MVRLPFYLLIAEDDPDDVLMLEMVLREECTGWLYEVVRDGEELIQHLEKHRDKLPDMLSLILMDINMPRMNGIQALSHLRTLPSYRRVPVIGYSTSSDPRLIRTFLEQGGNHFIVKPEGYESLLETVRSLQRLAETG